MDRKEAVAILRRKLGPSFAYRTNNKAIVDAERHSFQELERQKRAEEKEASSAMNKRVRELCEADPEYQRLAALHDKIKDARSFASEKANEYRVTVGRSDGPFFMVCANGDNWAEVVDKVSGTRENECVTL
jgi:hypothetical protein